MWYRSDLCLQTHTISRKTKPTAIPIMTPTATANSRPSQHISITISNTHIKQKSSLSFVIQSVALAARSSVPSYFPVHPLLAATHAKAAGNALNDRCNSSDHPLCDGRASVACHDPIIPDQATLTQFRRELCAVGLQATGHWPRTVINVSENNKNYTISLQ